MAGETSLYQEQWDSRVMTAFQQKGYLLRGMSMGPSKIAGKTLHFAMMGKGVAQDYTPRDKVKKMNVSKGEIQIQAGEWDAADDIYDYDLDRMAANTKDALVETAGMALGRKADLVSFQLMQAYDFNTNLPNQVVGAFANKFGPAEALKARRVLFELDVPTDTGDVFCGMPPIVFDNMMSYQVFGNSQWIGGNMPFVDPQRARTWRNIHFFELPTYLQTKNGTDGKFYMWSRASVGTGFTGEQLRTGWQYILDEKKWYYQSTLSAGATLIKNDDVGQPLGIIECRYKTDAEPTFA